MLAVFANFDYYSWVILPLIIFLSRMCDVTLGTLRHVFIAKGFKKIVPFLGFFEVLIWIVVVAQVMKNLNNVACYIAFASGFAMGTYLGLIIEERLALGLQVIRIITNQNCDDLLLAFKEEEHGVTLVDAYGGKGPVKMIFTIIQRQDVQWVVGLIRQHNPNAFYSVEEIKDTSQGIFTKHASSSFSTVRKMFPTGKSK
jgi:uncharacterized protein YebE (UPF0316 family)